MIKKILAALVVLGLLAAGAVYYQYSSFLASRPSNEHTEKIFDVPRGAAVATIARQLESQGILTDARAFGWMVRLKGAAPKIKAGEFRFYTDLTPEQVLEVLVKGEEVRYKLTFPEGYNIKDMARVVGTLSWLSAERFLEAATDEALARRNGFSTPTLEGFLFPATYELTKHQDERVLVGQMVTQFKNHWRSEYDTRARELGMTQLEIVTLASVVEKETGRADERPMVASVFHNRLKKGMKLESDPTIIYGLKDYDGDIRRSDIRRPHPWNTYVIKGLPPSPIANPGDEAIKATLWPAESPFLYFVAKGDGTHTFSETFAEHSAKVLQYQILRAFKK